MEIRKATASDIEGIIDVCIQSITTSCRADHKDSPEVLSGWLKNKTPEQVLSWISDPEHFLVVAEEESTIWGVALISVQGYLSLTYVLPSTQYQGIGKNLLSAVEGYATNMGCNVVTLESTKTAKEFYERNGYIAQEGVTQFLGMQVFPMRKNIVANKLNQSGTPQSGAPV